MHSRKKFFFPLRTQFWALEYAHNQICINTKCYRYSIYFSLKTPARASYTITYSLHYYYYNFWPIHQSVVYTQLGIYVPCLLSAHKSRGKQKTLPQKNTTFFDNYKHTKINIFVYKSNNFDFGERWSRSRNRICSKPRPEK